VLQELGQAQERAQAAEARAAAAEQAMQALQQQLQHAVAGGTSAHSNGAVPQRSSETGGSTHAGGQGGKAAGNGPVIIDISEPSRDSSSIGEANGGAEQPCSGAPDQGAEGLHAENAELRSRLSAADKRVAAASAVQVWFKASCSMPSAMHQCRKLPSLALCSKPVCCYPTAAAKRHACSHLRGREK
jgi:hypothetical protein